ncbi:hypothetical protein Tco_0517271 [Tanacetum coccineum]
MYSYVKQLIMVPYFKTSIASPNLPSVFKWRGDSVSLGRFKVLEFRERVLNSRQTRDMAYPGVSTYMDTPYCDMALAQNMNNSTMRYEKKLVHLEQPLSPAPELETGDLETINAYYELVNAQQEIKGNLDSLERLGYPMPQELCVSHILNSLFKDYEKFVQNYNMHSMRKTIAELHAMLRLTEKWLPKKAATPVVLSIRGAKDHATTQERESNKGLDLPSLQIGRSLEEELSYLSGYFSIYNVWKSVQYGVSNGLDMAYWGFLGVGTTFDIFQNIILIPYLEYGVLSLLDMAYCSLIFCGLW